MAGKIAGREISPRDVRDVARDLARDYGKMARTARERMARDGKRKEMWREIAEKYETRQKIYEEIAREDEEFTEFTENDGCCGDCWMCKYFNWDTQECMRDERTGIQNFLSRVSSLH